MRDEEGASKRQLVYRLGQLSCLGDKSDTNTMTVTQKGEAVNGFDEQMTLLMTYRPEKLI